MQDDTTNHARRSPGRAVIAAACAPLLTALCAGPALAAEPAPRMRSAELSVSVSVVRACSLATPARVVVADASAQDGAANAVGEEVALSCSYGDAPAVEVGPPSAQSALHAQLARGLAPASGTAGSAREPLVVTVLF